MDDSLVCIAEAVDAHTKLFRVAAERIDLNARGLVRDRQINVERWRVVILGRDGEVRAAHGAAGKAQSLERLRAGDLMTHVEVDVDEIGSAVFALTDQVVVPQLLCQRRAHACSFFPNYSCLLSHNVRR